ncbi:MAG: hypothetical protein ACJ79E_17000 [Anaeromyxobacteraceae bacterium]
MASVAALAAASEWQLHWLMPADAAAADLRPARAAAVEAALAAPSPEVPRAFALSRPAQPSAVAAPAPALAPERDAVEEAWRGTPVAVLPKDLGEVGPELKLALDKQQREDMEFCFRDAGGNGRMEAQTPRRAGSLVLFLEGREGAVDVVRAKIGQPGTLPAEVMECARQVAEGLEMKVSSAQPGKKLQYLYEIEE